MPTLIIATIALCAYAINLQYFTWWGISIFLVAELSELGSAWISIGTRSRIRIAQVTLSTAISLGVPIMSYAECTMFQINLFQYGNIVYVAANFIVHYLPSLWGISRLPLAIYAAHPKVPQLDAAALSVAYVMLYDPSQVYGCEIISQNEFALLALGASLLIEYAIITIYHK